MAFQRSTGKQKRRRKWKTTRGLWWTRRIETSCPSVPLNQEESKAKDPSTRGASDATSARGALDQTAGNARIAGTLIARPTVFLSVF